MALCLPPQNRIAHTISDTNLRSFLKHIVDKCSRRNVSKIVPLLKVKYTAADRCLRVLERKFEVVFLERLKDWADTFCNDFCKGLNVSI